MKRILSLVLLGWLLSSVSVFAAQASATSALVSCNTAGELEGSTTVYSGNVKVQFGNGSTMVVRAQTMTYDYRERRMVFNGQVEITGIGPTVQSKELSLDFGAAGLNLYRLNAAGIVTGNGPTLVAPNPEKAKAASSREKDASKP
jgi:lipopolysaccharide export system protein LptA